MNAKAATPDPVPADNVSLDADADAAARRRAATRAWRRPRRSSSQSGPIAEARDAQGELDQAAKEDPAKVLAGQKEALAKAEGDMAALQMQALAALTTLARGDDAKARRRGRQGMVGTEESDARQGRRGGASRSSTTRRTQVNALLKPLAANAIAEWEAAKTVLVAQLQDRSRDRAGSASTSATRASAASFVGLWDAVTGLPDWATEGLRQGRAATSPTA